MPKPTQRAVAAVEDIFRGQTMARVVGEPGVVDHSTLGWSLRNLATAKAFSEWRSTLR